MLFRSYRSSNGFVRAKKVISFFPQFLSCSPVGFFFLFFTNCTLEFTSNLSKPTNNNYPVVSTCLMHSDIERDSKVKRKQLLLSSNSFLGLKHNLRGLSFRYLMLKIYKSRSPYSMGIDGMTDPTKLHFFDNNSYG